MGNLLSNKCPDCNTPITFRFGLLTNLGLGIMFYSRCPMCFFNGDERSARLFIECDEATFRFAYLHGLPVVKYNTEDDEDDSENIADELDDEEEYSRSDIGFKDKK